MQVGGKVARCRENALQLLAFAFSVELLPPLAHEVKLRLIVHHNLNLLALLVESIAHCGVLSSEVVGKRHVDSSELLHVLGTFHQLADVKSRTGDGQKTNRSEH